MEQVNLASINQYRQRAESAAIQMQNALRNLPHLKMRINRLRRRYKSDLEKKALLKIPLLVAIPGHLAVGALTGFLIAPLMEFLLAGVIEHDSIRKAVSFFPVFAFWGFSVVIGHCFHQVNPHRHEIEPGRWLYSQGQVIAGMVLSVIYVFFLFKFVEAAHTHLPNKKQLLDLIFYLGFVELILGYFAVQGWETLLCNLRLAILRSRLIACRKKARWAAHQCELFSRYHKQMIAQYSNSHEIVFFDDVNPVHGKSSIEHIISSTLRDEAVRDKTWEEDSKENPETVRGNGIVGHGGMGVE